MNTWLVTGANGNLGRRLVQALAAQPDSRVVAVVRSERARAAVEGVSLDASQRERVAVNVLDYTDVPGLSRAATGCSRAVHLVGILKATRHAAYVDAHEHSTQALVQAAVESGIGHITYLSIVGSAPGSANPCLASKGRAEALLAESAVPTCILRVPMVLGEGDYASRALVRRAAQGSSFGFRMDSLEQPIYAGDVVRAILQAGVMAVRGSLDLAGPESLTRRALTERAATLQGRQTRVRSLPLGLGLTLAGAMERLLADPPVTRAMLEVLDHDDRMDPQPALERLGMDALTPLDEMLGLVLR